ncbi:hypothetical protein SLEP1_g34558 [Rubroshorea leprosula]|uniref:CCHC-type domain-containing protein n=1 Tax=Rubroshorea leprosula TaxID=152421 RepID=A0AAV5KKA9_9ROSI|nr:hypothetical protein SLEP1_g34558 [Rubroshorea leprosula]
MNLPSFKGVLDPNVVESWAKKLEKMFKLFKCTNGQKVDLAVFTLEAVLERKELEFMNLKQSDMTIDEYQVKFNSFVKFAPHIANDEAKKARKCQKGLKVSIRNKMETQDQKGKGKATNNQPFNKKFDQRGKRKILKYNKQTFDSCKSCGKNHGGKEYYWQTRACFKCGKTGHLIKDCPVLKGNTPTLIKGKIPISFRNAYVLMDFGSTHSFVSPKYVPLLHVEPETLDCVLVVNTPSKEVLTSRTIYRSYRVMIEGRVLLANLILLGIVEFDVILVIRFEEEKVGSFPLLVSYMQADKMLLHECYGYLAYVFEFKDKPMSVEGIQVVEDFPDVFPKELLGLPPDGEIEFIIDLVLGTSPISQQPYRMAPAKLTELKK